MTNDLFHDPSRQNGGSPSGHAGSASSTSGPGPIRELPVLFQLGDVSRPRTQAPASSSAAISAPKPPAPPVLQSTPAPATLPAVEPFAPLALSELSKPYTPAALEPATLWTPSVASLLDDPSLITGGKPENAAATAKASEPAAQQKDAAESSKNARSKSKAPESASSTKASESTAKVNRPEAREESNKRRQPAKKTDWFSTHGKLIAIGFVLALAATVVIARNQKKAPTPSTDEQWAMKHPGGAADSLGEGGPNIEMPSVAVDLPSDAQPSPKEDEASPAAIDKLVDAKSKSDADAKHESLDMPPQVDLLPPTLPQSQLTETKPGLPPPVALVEKPAEKSEQPTGQPAGAPSADPLFTWPQRETQVAAKPAGSATAASTAQKPMNPGEVINPYARSAPPPAASAASEGPIATTAARSPYVLPGSPQDVPAASPPTSVYGTAGPGAPGNTAPAGAYAPAPASPSPAYSPNTAYAPASSAPTTSAYAPPAYSPPPAPAPAYSPAPPGPPAAGYAPATNYTPAPPTTPSPYLPVGGPAAPAPSAGPTQPSYGAPAGSTNTQPPSGYRYERTGSGLY